MSAIDAGNTIDRLESQPAIFAFVVLIRTCCLRRKHAAPFVLSADSLADSLADYLLDMKSRLVIILLF